MLDLLVYRHRILIGHRKTNSKNNYCICKDDNQILGMKNPKSSLLKGANVVGELWMKIRQKRFISFGALIL